MINTIIPSDLTNSFSEPYNKIDILKKLLSAAFDSQLIVLENSARSHLACVETSIKTANSVALLCSSISKQVTEKLYIRAVRSNEIIQNYQFCHCSVGHNCDLPDWRVMAARNKWP